MIKERTQAIIKEKPYLVVLGIFFASIIPMLYLGLFAYPQADDFVFSIGTHDAWSNQRSLIGVLIAAINKVRSHWHEWQGTFFSVFLFTLQPGIWGESFYHIVPCVFIGILSISIYIFINSVLINCFCIDKVMSRTVSALIIMYVVWFMPDVCSAFYWYNGAVHYVFMFSVMLINCVFIVKVSTSTGNKMILLLGLCIASVIVGGGNFISALLMAVIFSGVLLYILIKKRKDLLVLIVPMVLFGVSFVINVIAPGNSVRQEATGTGPMNPVNAIMYSFRYAMDYCFSGWMKIFVIILLLLMIPFIWKGLEKSQFDFRYPGVFVLVSFCLVASMFTPSVYATYDSGPGRVKNLIFSFYIMMLAFDEVYLIGWLKKEGLKLAIKTKVCTYVLVLCFVALFSELVVNRCDNGRMCNPAMAIKLVLNNSAKEYGETIKNNIEILNGDEKEVVINKITDGPVFYYSTEIDVWKAGTKYYYNKTSVEYAE